MPVAVLGNDVCRERAEGRIQSERHARLRELREAFAEPVDFLLDLGLQADNGAFGEEGINCCTAVAVDVVFDGRRCRSRRAAHLSPFGVLVPLPVTLGRIDLVKVVWVFNVKFVWVYADNWAWQTSSELYASKLEERDPQMLSLLRDVSAICN